MVAVRSAMPPVARASPRVMAVPVTVRPSSPDSRVAVMLPAGVTDSVPPLLTVPPVKLPPASSATLPVAVKVPLMPRAVKALSVAVWTLPPLICKAPVLLVSAALPLVALIVPPLIDGPSTLRPLLPVRPVAVTAPAPTMVKTSSLAIVVPVMVPPPVVVIDRLSAALTAPPKLIAALLVRSVSTLCAALMVRRRRALTPPRPSVEPAVPSRMPTSDSRAVPPWRTLDAAKAMPPPVASRIRRSPPLPPLSARRVSSAAPVMAPALAVMSMVPAAA